MRASDVFPMKCQEVRSIRQLSSNHVALTTDVGETVFTFDVYGAVRSVDGKQVDQ